MERRYQKIFLLQFQDPDEKHLIEDLVTKLNMTSPLSLFLQLVGKKVCSSSEEAQLRKIASRYSFEYFMKAGFCFFDGFQSRLPWHLSTQNLNCAKHNARSKHVEPHLRSFYASRSTSRSSLSRHHIFVHGSFLCQAPSAKCNSLLVRAIQ